MIRAAQKDDLSQIFQLYKEVGLQRELLSDRNYCHRAQKEGFLLGLDTKETLRHLIENAPVFFISENEGRINGYINAHYDDQFLDDEYKIWFDADLKQIYYHSQQTISIHTIAVHPKSKHTGVAAQLLAALEKSLQEMGIKYLFSIVSLGPLTNCASLLFHTKHGFKRLAMSKPQRMFNLDHYFSTLMYKEI